MDKSEAQSIVASLLALNTVEHVVAFSENPDLLENTQYAGQRNLQVAEALDILPQYWNKLATHYPEHLLKGEPE